MRSAIEENVARVLERISTAAARAGRRPEDVQLVAATKTRSAAQVAQVVEAGVTILGENRVQEAAPKIPLVAEFLARGAVSTPPPEWHLIGTLQTNKVKLAAHLFQMIQSVDSMRLVTALSQRVVEAGPPEAARLPVLLEIYLGDDPKRPGFRRADLWQSLEGIFSLPRVRLSGLMTVAPLGCDLAGARHAFRTLRELRDRMNAQYPGVHCDELSMGMSDDFEVAVEEGSTLVRIGQALFGPRLVMR